MHLARSEDGIVNRMVAGRPTLLETTYAGKTGVNALPPMGPDWGDWARSVQVDLPVLLAYYQAVQANTIGFLDGLGADHLNRQVDLGQPGPGTMTVAEVLGTIIVPHTAMHCGEISCLKGLQSARGYTF